MKLAIVLLVILAALSALSTFIPQGEEAQFYFERYSPFPAGLIVSLHFHNFFRSTLFLLPTALFFISLAVCMTGRMVKRSRRRAPKRFGPDLIHIGILILIIGGTISLIAKREGYIYLSKGEYVELPDGYQLYLDSFEYTTYDDGRPKDYVSAVELRLDGETLRRQEIRVNRPLKIGSLKIYQDSYSTTQTVVLHDPDGNRHAIKIGEGFRVDDRFYFFMGVEPGFSVHSDTAGDQLQEDTLMSAVLVFEELDADGAPVQTHGVRMGETINRFVIDDVLTVNRTGLRITRDIGFLPVIAAFIIIGAGLALTFVQKIGDMNQ
jgi:cytochrome c biogenesis protein